MEIDSQEKLDAAGFPIKGPCAGWTVPIKFASEENFLNIVNNSVFCKEGKFIECGLCINHFADKAKVGCRKNEKFTWGRFRDHIKKSDSHQKSQIATDNIAKRKRINEETNKSKQKQPKTEQSRLASFFSKKKKIEKEQSGEKSSNSEEGPRSKIVASKEKLVPVLTNAAKRQHEAIQTNISDKKEQVQNITSVCIGILKRSNLSDGELQKGMDYMRSYYKEAAGQTCRPINDQADILSIFSKQCTGEIR